jgi:hypothetical protein
MFVRGGNLTLIDCVFHDNTAQAYSGAVHSQIDPAGQGVVANCTFLRNRTLDPTVNGAGGMAVLLGEYSVHNCRFIENASARIGGGLWFNNSRGEATNCTFIDNSGTVAGGASVSRNAVATFANCLFAGNVSTLSASNDAAALWVGDGTGGPSSATVVNCTFAANRAPTDGAALIVTHTSHVDVAHCVFWSNTPAEIALKDTATIAVSYSAVHGGWTGAGNIDVDPLFVRAASPGADGDWGTDDDDYGDLRLTGGSPCIDAGDPAFAPAPCEHDLDGACRRWDGNADSVARVDMGAYEFGAPRGDLDGDCQIGLSDLSALLSNFGTLDGARPDQGDLDGDGDVDLADLTTTLSGFGLNCP